MKFNISLKVLPLLACGMLMASCNDFLKQEPLTQSEPQGHHGHQALEKGVRRAECAGTGVHRLKL